MGGCATGKGKPYGWGAALLQVEWCRVVLWRIIREGVLWSNREMGDKLQRECKEQESRQSMGKAMRGKRERVEGQRHSSDASRANNRKGAGSRKFS